MEHPVDHPVSACVEYQAYVGRWARMGRMGRPMDHAAYHDVRHAAARFAQDYSASRRDGYTQHARQIAPIGVILAGVLAHDVGMDGDGVLTAL